jgi:hypothetical protein
MQNVLVTQETPLSELKLDPTDGDGTRDQLVGTTTLDPNA